MRVLPLKIGDVLLAEPCGIVHDAAVAEAQTPGARTTDDRSPHAWVVFSDRDCRCGGRRGRSMRGRERA